MIHGGNRGEPALAKAIGVLLPTHYTDTWYAAREMFDAAAV